MPELGPPIRDLGGRRCRLWIVQQTIYAGVHVHAARRRTCTCEVAIEVGAHVFEHNQIFPTPGELARVCKNHTGFGP